ncbi:MFS transporter [Amycolatopsis sp.]|uniref:MFS transporter n=1 Tax=Amycolatopsis sp. TaxID=37632 RepID=UPI002C18EC4D|nr:MFS transporter [Amycolatopsis sp.]HVV07667.1 MFS transporter [Amycolatopsis sp.]
MTRNFRWFALGALLLAEAMNLLDTTIVQVAAPSIRDGLHATEGQLQWLTAGYTLSFALLLITGGRLGDILGRRRVFVTGVVVFVVCSGLCALAPSVAVLMAMRVLQGVGAALLIPQTFGLIRAMFEGPELSRALGLIGPVMALSAVAGPLLGGVLTEAAGWRSVFAVNVPLGVLVVLLAPLIEEDRSPARPRLDVTGTVLAAGAMGLLIYPVVQGGWLLLLPGLGCSAVFVVQQRHKARCGAGPLVEPGLFRGRVFPASMLGLLLFYAVLSGLMFVLVVYFQVARGEDALGAGLMMLPWSAGLGAGSLLAGTVLVPRLGPGVMRIGAVLVLAGLGGMVFLLATPALWAPLAVCGLGMGLFTVPFFGNALSRVGRHETGSASGLLNAVQQLGASFGVALLGTVFFRVSVTAALDIAVGLIALVLVLTFAMLPARLNTLAPHHV